MEFNVEDYYRNFPRGTSPIKGQIQQAVSPDSFEAASNDGWWYEMWDGERWINQGNDPEIKSAYKAQQEAISAHPSHPSRVTIERVRDLAKRLGLIPCNK